MPQQKLTYEQWMQAVSDVIVQRIGLAADDLPDCCYRDWYDAGTTVRSAASRAIRSAKADTGL